MINTVRAFKKNLYLKIIVLLFSYGFVAYKIYNHNNLTEALTFFHTIKWGNTEVLTMVVVFYLMFLNWGLEAYKWKILIKPISWEASEKARRTIFSGVSYGLVLSRTTGSLMAKWKHLPKEKLVSGTLATAIGGGFQGIVTLLFGMVGLIWLSVRYVSISSQTFIFPSPIIVNVVIIIGLLAIIKRKKLKHFINTSKWCKNFRVLKDYSPKTLGAVFLAAVLRYWVYTTQYALLIKLFVNDILFIDAFCSSSVIYLIMSLMPALFLGGIGIRGSVSLFVLGYLTALSLEVIAASFLIWIINIILPAAIGFGGEILTQSRRSESLNLEHVR